MNKGNILIILTSHNQLGNSSRCTGFHYGEMAIPYCEFTGAGFEVTLASIQGGRPPYDPASFDGHIEDNPPSVIAFLSDDKAKKALSQTRAVSELRSEDYVAVFLPGGHGAMWDFPENPDLVRLISELFQANKPIGALCHGVAGLIGAKDRDGNSIVKNRRINCFTNAEEVEIGLDNTVPFLLENCLCELGAKFECADKFEKCLVQDGNLITGQNPASAGLVARALVNYLQSER